MSRMSQNLIKNISIFVLVAFIIASGTMYCVYEYMTQPLLVQFESQFNIKLPNGVIPIKSDNRCGFWSPYPSFSFSIMDNDIKELENILLENNYSLFKVEDIQMSNCYSRFNTIGKKVLVSENNKDLSVAKYLVLIPEENLLEAIYFIY